MLKPEYTDKQILLEIQNNFFIRDLSVLSSITKDQFDKLILFNIKFTQTKRSRTKERIYKYLEESGIKFAEPNELNEEDGLIGYYINLYYSNRSELLDLMCVGITSTNLIPKMSYTDLYALLINGLERYSHSRFIETIKFLNKIGKLPSTAEEDKNLYQELKTILGDNFTES